MLSDPSPLMIAYDSAQLLSWTWGALSILQLLRPCAILRTTK